MSVRIRTAAVMLLAILLVAPAFAQGPGADTYKAKCAMCHGADGLAATPMAKSMKVVSFKDPTMVQAPDAHRPTDKLHLRQYNAAPPRSAR